jgi:hypothetical protein
MIAIRLYTTLEYDMTYEFRCDTKEDLIENLTDILKSADRAKEIAEGAELEGWEGGELLLFMQEYDCRVHEEPVDERVHSIEIEDKNDNKK